MCGIAGVLDFQSNTPSQKEVQDLVGSLSHRGPDGTGFYSDKCFSFGMSRLAIIDVLGGAQPLFNEAGSVALIANGEIYNYKQLRHQLELKGHQFHSRSDSEVIVHLYEEKGEACVQELRGMYAFALWDKRVNKLLLVRDRLGIKPLYYFNSKDQFLFSSEIRPMLKNRNIVNKINYSALYSFLLFGFVSDPHTMIQGIQALLPGHMLIVKNGEVKVKKYWEISEINEGEPSSSGNVSSRVRELLNESVNLRLMSDVPLGVFLSGGIDSTALTALASQNAEQKVKTFSIVFKEKEFDESFYSRQVAEHFKTDHSELLLEKEQFLSELPIALQSMDQPTIDGMNTYFISQAVKQAGITVALSGVGGDELFLGYSSFKKLRYLDSYKKLSFHIPPFAKESFSTLLQRFAGGRKMKKCGLYIQHSDQFIHPYFWCRMLFSPREVALLLNVHEESVWQFFRNEQERLLNVESDQTGDRLNLQSRLELRHYMGSQLLRDTDVMGMRNSLEIRTPFLDHNLVQYVLSLPGKVKLNHKTQKHLLTESLKDLIPKNILGRRKMGFVFPFQKWMKQSCRETMETTLSMKSASTSNYLNIPYAQNIWSDYLNNKETWARPWSLFVLTQWISNNIREELCVE